MLSEAFVNGLSAGSKQLTGLSSLPESSDDSELLERALKAEEEVRLLKLTLSKRDDKIVELATLLSNSKQELKTNAVSFMAGGDIKALEAQHMADNTTSNIIAGLAPVLNTINTSLSNIHHAVTNKTCDDELEKVNEKLLNFSNDLPKKFTSLKHLITSEKNANEEALQSIESALCSLSSSTTQSQDHMFTLTHTSSCHDGLCLYAVGDGTKGSYNCMRGNGCANVLRTCVESSTCQNQINVEKNILAEQNDTDAKPANQLSSEVHFDNSGRKHNSTNVEQLTYPYYYAPYPPPGFIPITDVRKKNRRKRKPFMFGSGGPTFPGFATFHTPYHQQPFSQQSYHQKSNSHQAYQPPDQQTYQPTAQLHQPFFYNTQDNNNQMQQADQQQTQVYTGHSNDNQMEQTGQ